MKKILITTDFSPNSVAGLLFAAQLASQNKATLSFIYVQTLIKPTSWSDVTFEEYKQEETEKRLQELRDFVSATYQQAGLLIDYSVVKYIVEDHASPIKAILAYAHSEGFDCICSSTRGANTIKKIMGSNTSELIQSADIPVISVPADYQMSPILHLLYASDFKNLETELQKVVTFNQDIKAQIEVLHFNSLSESTEDDKLKAVMERFADHQVKFHLENTDYLKALVIRIKEAITASKTSMLVMFTAQDRTFFEKIFMASITAEYAFDSTVPLLVFKK